MLGAFISIKSAINHGGINLQLVMVGPNIDFVQRNTNRNIIIIMTYNDDISTLH